MDFIKMGIIENMKRLAANKILLSYDPITKSRRELWNDARKILNDPEMEKSILLLCRVKDDPLWEDLWSDSNI